MNELITANFFNYRNGEFLQFMKNGLAIVGAYDTAALLLQARTSTLQTETNAMDVAFQPVLANELTPELLVLDTRRDKALMGIKFQLETELYKEDSTIVTAAESLKSNYLSHGERIDKLSYQQETAVVNALLEDWSKGSMLTAVTTVGLTTWVGLLKTINTEFDAKYVARAKTLPQPAEIDAKRATIKTAYDELVKDITAYSRIAADKSDYLKIIKELNGLIDNYNVSANQRLASNGTSDTPPPTVAPIN
jgi:Family of unknown function (DUF6261)